MDTEQQIKFNALLEDIVDGKGVTKDKPGFWIASGYQFKNDGEKVYIAMHNDKTKELEWFEVDSDALLNGKIIHKK